jgi:hypothetical protein
MSAKKPKPPTPKDGVCCSCGYSGNEQTKCQKREDRTHCVHWWEVEEEP